MDKVKKYLGKTVKIKIDRPLGSKHPKHNIIYSLNYGYVPNTKAADGEELDAYVLGVSKPMESFEGICLAIIHRTNDNEDKLVIVPKEQQSFTDDEIKALTEFQENFFQSEIVR